MKYWVLLSQFELLQNYVPLAQLAEECGYAGVLIPDHVVFPVSYETTHPIKHPTTPEDMFPDPLSLIVAMSACTKRLEFATYVYVLPMREPFPVAKQVATTAMLSGYRFSFGVGVGWLPEEFELMRQPFNLRGKKTDEMIDILRDLWADGYAEHHGELYSFNRCGMFPVPEQPIPIWVGGKTPAAIKRAARCEGAMPMNVSVEDASRLLAMIGAEREKVGKKPHADPTLIIVQDIAEIAAYQDLEGQGATDALVFPWTTQITFEVARKPPRQRLPELELFARKAGL
jgi:probable F420-dependent oxidoreductase